MYGYVYLCADGWLMSAHSGKYDQVGFSQKLDDKNMVIKFAEEMGLGSDRVKQRDRFKSIRRKPPKLYHSAEFRFICKPLTDDLKAHRFLEFKQLKNKEIPGFVLNSIKNAKSEAQQSNSHWYETESGKIALAWLLGCFDGDGTWNHGGRNWKSATIYSSSKGLLQRIKNEFGGSNKVFINSKENMDVLSNQYIQNALYGLTLGPDLFDAILNSCTDSMERKRPFEYR